MSLSVQHYYPDEYRGFVIGCHIQRGPHVEGLCYTPMWMPVRHKLMMISNDEDGLLRECVDEHGRLKIWHECSTWADSLEAAEKLARECIDYNYLIEAEEFIRGHKLSLGELIEFEKARTGR